MEFFDVALDFDGVVHRYSQGLHDGSVYDQIMPGFLEVYRRWKTAGISMVIYSCRRVDQMEEWLTKMKLDIPVRKEKPIATVYVDDRGFHFREWDDFAIDIIENAVYNNKHRNFIETPYGVERLDDRQGSNLHPGGLGTCEGCN